MPEKERSTNCLSYGFFFPHFEKKAFSSVTSVENKIDSKNAPRNLFYFGVSTETIIFVRISFYKNNVIENLLTI